MANISKPRSRKRAKGEICHLVSSTNPTDSSSSFPVHSAEQPLNLCVRDESLPVLLIPNGTVTEEQVPRNPTIRRRKKRSAIFLPPEKLADNDVCICKFKFVAGHTPRLQEKKILSLDSGGNFRFFPELQHQQEQQQQQEKKKQTVNSPQTANAQQQQIQQQLGGVKPIPDLLPIETVRQKWSATNLGSSPPLVPASVPPSVVVSHRTQVQSSNKRLSRRQKMEQTFGDKGFLIQTQHVPATEGSAFCKFRQLKKFTRYLYRSWRHYLPEENQAAISPTDEGHG